MELRDKIPGMSFVKINIINILAKGIKLIILSEGIIKLQHSEAVVKNSQVQSFRELRNVNEEHCYL